MRSITLLLISLTYLTSATDDGSAFGDDVPVVAPKRSKLTLRKPQPTHEESESAFGDVEDYLKGASEKSSQPEVWEKPEPDDYDGESAFGDVDYLRDVVENAHAAPRLRKKGATEDVPQEESAFGDVQEGDNGDSLSENGIQQIEEQESLVEETALGGELEDDAADALDDKEMKEDAEKEHELRSEEVRASETKKCTGTMCDAEKWSPVRNVHAYGPSGKPADWKPKRIFGSGKELMAEEAPRERGPRIYSRHQAVEHQAPPKRSLGEFVSSIMER